MVSAFLKAIERSRGYLGYHGSGQPHKLAVAYLKSQSRTILT
jgi:hypothetical protein